MRLIHTIRAEVFGLIGVIVLGWMCIWYIFGLQPVQVRLDLTNPQIARGTFGSDPEGVWFTGNTQIVVSRFINTPWQSLAWRWRQAPGTPLDVHIHLDTRHFTTVAPVQWRVVRLLMPRVEPQTRLDIRSGTNHIVGDSRDLGMIMSQLTVVRLATPVWWDYGVVADYWVLIVIMGIWLAVWQGQWLGVGALSLFSAVYIVMLAQEVLSGFANPTLWIDRGSRLGVIGLMAGWTWWRWIRQPARMRDNVPPPGRRFGLDVVRAVAVLCVVCSHFTPLLFVQWSGDRTVFRWLIYLGPIGVDIFFVLSGYLIGGIVLRTVTHFTDFATVTHFWMRRWLRTLPVAYVSAIVVWFVAAPQDLRSYFASIFFVGALHPAYIAKELVFWWSLGVEELFYVLLPLLLYVLSKKIPAARAFLVSSAIIGGSALVLRAVLLMVSDESLWRNVNLTVYARLDSLVWGVVVVWIRNYRPQWFTRIVQQGFAPGALIFGVGVAFLVDQYRWDALAMFGGHTIVVIGTSLLIPVCEALPQFRLLAVNRVITGIALVSYSLYLYHGMIVDLLVRLFGAATSWPMLVGLAIGYAGIAFGVASISYYVVEVPLLRWRDIRFPPQQRNSQRTFHQHT